MKVDSDSCQVPTNVKKIIFHMNLSNLLLEDGKKGTWRVRRRMVNENIKREN